jgi:parallel beta-helix repeat protein
MRTILRAQTPQATLGLILLGVISGPAWAGTLCVNPHGTGGCKSTISAAVAAASPNDTINVARGTYPEDVVIGKPLSLIGAGDEKTVIDATGLSNGINIDGHNNSGLAHVSVTGFTVKNANFEGILITDSSFITVANNHVTGNDKSLSVSGGPPTCPGLPDYFADFQGFDCGEGMHLSGVDHSTVSGNLVEKNAGGILVSDDTGSTHDNLISGNTVQNNPLDCGITIASHIVIPFLPEQPLRGIYHNTIIGNQSLYNGLTSGEGAGIGLFAAAPGAQNWGNVVEGNISVGNALPGVSMHSHSPLQNLNDNLIVGNFLARNGPDSDPGVAVPVGIDVFADEAAGGADPITGTVITRNIIKGEGIDIVVATSGGVTAHFNDLFGNVGVSNLSTGSVDATLNWWGCSRGPGANGCSAIAGFGILTTPFLTSPAGSDQDDQFDDHFDDHHDDHHGK